MGRRENKCNYAVYRKSSFYRNSKPSVKDTKTYSSRFNAPSMTTAVPCRYLHKKDDYYNRPQLIYEKSSDLLFDLEKVWRRLLFFKCPVCCHRYRAGLGLAAQNCGATVPLGIFSREGMRMLQWSWMLKCFWSKGLTPLSSLSFHERVLVQAPKCHWQPMEVSLSRRGGLPWCIA